MLIITQQLAICTSVLLGIDLENNFKKLSKQSAQTQQMNTRGAPESNVFCTKPSPSPRGEQLCGGNGGVKAETLGQQTPPLQLRLHFCTRSHMCRQSWGSFSHFPALLLQPLAQSLMETSVPASSPVWTSTSPREKRPWSER